MEIVGLQWNLEWEKKPLNYARVEELTAAAEPEPGALLVLPEMFATGFSMNVPDIAEEGEGETVAFLAELARRHSIHVLAGLVTRGSGANGKAYNEAVAIDPEGRETARYRKMHPFSYAGEDEHYNRGDAPVLCRWGDVMAAPFICYDLRFPEIFRLAAQGGAELFVVIANWPAARVEHWRLLLRARAIENQAFVVGLNRCGSDPKLEYPGASMVIDPHGRILQELGAGEGWLKVDVDPETVRACRRDLPFLRDLRAELFRD